MKKTETKKKKKMANVFPSDAQQRIKAVLDSVLAGQTYSHGKTTSWTEAIGDGVLEALADLRRHKLVVDVLVLEKGETGYKLYSAVRWDDQSDDAMLVRFENDTLRAVVSVYALAK